MFQLLLSGAIPALVDLLKLDSEEIQSVAASVLCNISENDDIRVALTAAQAGVILIQLLGSPVDDIQSRAAIILSDLACIEGNQVGSFVLSVSCCNDKVCVVCLCLCACVVYTCVCGYDVCVWVGVCVCVCTCTHVCVCVGRCVCVCVCVCTCTHVCVCVCALAHIWGRRGVGVCVRAHERV